MKSLFATIIIFKSLKCYSMSQTLLGCSKCGKDVEKRFFSKYDISNKNPLCAGCVLDESDVDVSDIISLAFKLRN